MSSVTAVVALVILPWLVGFVGIVCGLLAERRGHTFGKKVAAINAVTMSVGMVVALYSVTSTMY